MNKNIDISNIIEMIKNMDFEPLMNVLEYVILYYVVKAINREDEATYSFTTRTNSKRNRSRL